MNSSPRKTTKVGNQRVCPLLCNCASKANLRRGSNSLILLLCCGLLLFVAACVDGPQEQLLKEVEVKPSSQFECDTCCKILTFSVYPTYGSYASDFTFSWATQNADSVDIEPGIGQGLSANGELKVTLFESNWIKLIAYGPGGPVEESIWVEAAWPGGSTWWKKYANELNNSQSPYKGPQTGHLVWTRSIGEIHSPIVGEDGSVFVQTDHSIHCLSPKGYTKWNNYNLGHIHSCIVNPKGDLYVTSYQEGYSYLRKIHPNGNQIWEYTFTENIFYSSSLLLQPQETISVWALEPFGCAHYRGRTFIIDKTGTYITQFEYPYDLYDPSILLGTYFVGASWSNLYCFNFEGYCKWMNDEYYRSNLVISSPEGIFYIVLGYPYWNFYTHSILTAYDVTGEEVWSFTELAEFMSIKETAQDIHGNLYLICCHHLDRWCALLSLNPSGNVRWSYIMENWVGYLNSLAVDQSGIVYVVLPMKVLAINQYGSLLWDYEFDHEYDYHWSSCCLSMDETLYVTHDTKLYAFRDSNP